LLQPLEKWGIFQTHVFVFVFLEQVLLVAKLLEGSTKSGNRFFKQTSMIGLM
jgi:hypothetical protein